MKKISSAQLALINEHYGELKAHLHIAGYTFERGCRRLRELLTDGWQQCGDGFRKVDDFLESLGLDQFAKTVEDKREIAKLIKELRPEVSTRAIGRALKVKESTMRGIRAPEAEKAKRNNRRLRGTRALATGAAIAKLAERQEVKAAARLALEVQKNIVPPDLPPLSQRCRLLCASVADLASKLEPASVDWIVTDPPYEESALPLYAQLAHTAAAVLKPGGSCLVMVGQSFLPQVMAALATKLQYHWIGAYLTPGGQAAQIWPRKVNTFWKPLLWYTNGAFTGERWYGDVVSSEVNDTDKTHHEWGQSESGMMEVISKFTNTGDVVLDPFLGGGTTGIVALASDRLFIGADIDQSVKDQAEIRLRRVM
jgi:16S rRNA G966 N2-methylase RsmD